MNAAAQDPVKMIEKLVEAQGEMLRRLVEAQGEGSRAELDRLAQLLAEQVQAQNGALDETETRLATSYGLLRQQLGGPVEGLAIDVPRIRCVLPEAAAAGDEVQIHLQNAGAVIEVAFSGGGGPVLAAPKAGSTSEVVLVDVPGGAATGTVTVRTARGDAVSLTPFVVGRRQRPADPSVLLIRVR